MSILIGFVFVNAIGYLIIMFIPSVSYVKGTFIVNIASLISMVLLFVFFLEILYRRKILNKDLVEDNIEVCNEIQPCIGDFIEFDETTGFLDNNKTIDKEENFNNSLYKINENQTNIVVFFLNLQFNKYNIYKNLFVLKKRLKVIYF